MKKTSRVCPFGLPLIYLSIALSPFYFWESGLPQVSHFVFALGAIIWLLERRMSIPITPPSKYALAFALYALLVNGVVYVKYADAHTAWAGLYYVFNAGVFLLLTGVGVRLARENSFRSFAWRLSYVLLGLLALELAMQLLGFGRTFGELRATGTFNDPNQFAHWVIWVAVIASLAGWYVFQSWTIGVIALLLASSTILLNASRSGLLGVGWFMFVMGWVWIARMSQLLLGNARVHLGVLSKVFFSAFFLIVVGSLGLGVADGGGQVAKFFSERGGFLVQRIVGGLEKGNENLVERGYDRLFLFPEYILLGAGEGANERWAEKTVFLGEIHSTLAGVLFSYGAIGFLLLIALFLHVWRIQPTYVHRLILLSPLFYSVGTYNLRNWFFWIGLALAWSMAYDYHLRNVKSTKRSENETPSLPHHPR